METIQRAASAASEALFGEHGEHGHTTHGNTGTTTRTNAAGEMTHEPLSGRTGDTKAGEPYDAGNLDERSQQRIAASRDEPTNITGTAREYTSTTGTSGGYAPTTFTTGGTGGYAPTTFTTGTAGGYAPTTSTTRSTSGEGELRRSSDISPRSSPATGTIPIPSNIDRHAGGGSYSSARETAARAMGAAETPGSSVGAAGYAGAGAAAGGTGLWSAGQGREEVDARDGGQQGQQARFAGEGGKADAADAADVAPSRAHAEGMKVKDAGETSTTGPTGVGAGARPTSAASAGARPTSAASAGAATGGEGAPLGRRQSLTAHLPGEPGGEGMRRTSGAGEGTGEQWVKSSGMKADGGDFDASAPGAGREADRLLTEKGIKRSGADEKEVTGQMDTKAPNGYNNASESEKLGGLKDKLMNKLHKGPL